MRGRLSGSAPFKVPTISNTHVPQQDPQQHEPRIMSEPSNRSFEPSTLVDLLRVRGADQPNRIGYTYLTEAEGQELELTHQDLDRRARAIAARLTDSGAAGGRVLILAPPGLEYIAAFFGCLYAGAVAVPLYPPRPNKSLDRFEAVARDAQPIVTLTTTTILNRIEPLLPAHPHLEAIGWLAVDSIGDEAAAQWREPSINEGSLALLQYTSGSTAAPKGVMVTHANLLYNERMIKEAFGQSEDSIIVSWLPLYHDMGLIGGMLQPLYLGARCILMSPVAFLQQPLRWLQAVSHYGATTSGGPSFAYEMCVRKISREQRLGLDLTSWDVAFNGSEPVSKETLDRFAETFAECGFRREAFRPCYGLAEATLLVSSAHQPGEPSVKVVDAAALERNQAISAGESSNPADSAKTRNIVGCGRPLLDESIRVVNPESLAECAPGEIGEIWVSGPNVARGYWNKPDETERAFNARIANSVEGPFLRTGDLGFSDRDELFVTGRIKELIIMRGLNHYPRDIELTVERSHSSLRPGCGAAFSISTNEGERLVIVQEIDRRGSYGGEDVFDAMRQAVAEEHGLNLSEIALVKRGGIPKTSSGKIQRGACRADLTSGRLEIVAHWQAGAAPHIEPEHIPSDESELTGPEIESWLASRIAAILNVHSSEIDPGKPLTQYGLDSIAAIEILHAIETGLNVALPITTLFQNKSITGLAATCVRSGKASRHQRVIPTQSKGSRMTLLAPSQGQRALWFLHQIDPGSAAYNISSAASIKSEINVEVLERAFQSLVDLHASLRTTFIEINGEPFQQVRDGARPDFDYHDASGWKSEEVNRRLIEEAHRPFDLTAGPLIRVTVLRTATSEYVLLLVLHHIIADLWSIAVLANDLAALYEATASERDAAISPPEIEYTDYVAWRNEMLASADGERLWNYWKDRLSGPLPSLNLPADFPRPPIQSYRGASHSFSLDSELTLNLKRLSQAGDVTLFTTLLTAFQTLLHRYTGQPDILVGSPASGRSQPELARVIGYFVNPVVLRATFANDPTFHELLGGARTAVPEALEHQDYPFTLLVERLQPERDASRSPVFQAMFAFEKSPEQSSSSNRNLASFALGAPGAKLRLGRLELESLPLEQRVSQFDLTLMIAETGAGLAASLQYSTDLFHAATAARFAAHFENLLKAVVSDPRRAVSQLTLLSQQEQRQLLFDWNRTAIPYQRDILLHTEFERRAAQSPNAVALIFGFDQLTYKELNASANRMAHRLREQGVGPESLVGICAHRSPAMLIGLLGVLKAGGVFVSMDPDYPRERLSYILEDSRAGVLLTEETLLDGVPSWTGKTICVDLDWRRSIDQESAGFESGAVSNNLAYVIYTSGSTGKPKGVAIQHQSAVAMIHWAAEVFSDGDLAGVLASTSICFDLSIFELFVPLSRGGAVVLAENALDLHSLPAADKVTLINTVPSAMAQLIEAAPLGPNVRTVNLAGEPLQNHLVQRIYSRSQVTRVFNLYGPSEDTTYSTIAVAERGAVRQPAIGRPIANSQVYLLDSNLQPVPVGVPGELRLAGDGLARGYLNRPDLTAERFIPNLFSETPGGRVYGTGDLARYLADGEIEFLGRIDNQVKIRGFRIELGEIETALRNYERVQDVVVNVWEPKPGDKRLVAYVVVEAGDTFDTNEVRAFLRRTLPEFMTPSVFMTLDALPLTPNGKIDRRALPSPTNARLSGEELRSEPRTATEQAIAKMWCDVLAVERVAADIGFFEAGGHSLLAVQVISRVRNHFKVDLPLRGLLEAPTVAELAARVDKLIAADAKLGVTSIKRLPRQSRRIKAPRAVEVAVISHAG